MRYPVAVLALLAACKHEPAAVSPSPTSPTAAESSAPAPSSTAVAAASTASSAAPVGPRKSCATWTPSDGGGVDVKWPAKEDVKAEDAGASLHVKENKLLGPGESFASLESWEIGHDCPIPPGYVDAFPTPKFDDKPTFVVEDAGADDKPPPLPASTTANGLKVTERALSVVGKLPPELVRKRLRQRIPVFRNCYAQALKVNPTLKGVVALTFVIDAKGAVDQPALVAKATTIEGDVGSCAVRMLKTVTFTAPETGTVKVTYTLDFSNVK